MEKSDNIFAHPPVLHTNRSPDIGKVAAALAKAQGCV